MAASAGTRAGPALRVTSLVKRYGPHAALAGLSLELARGRFVALLGPNGAGKSTLFQVLTGLFAADEGEAQLDGVELRRQPSRALRAIGVVFQQSSLDLDLSVARNLSFHAALQGLPGAIAGARIDAGLEVAGLTADRNRAVRELSGGNRRKVELVRALLHRPAVLLMDEPTVGLDPKSRRDLLATIRADIAERQTLVLWATHLVEEAVGADQVLVLHAGRLLADGSPSAVTEALGGPTLEEAFIRATARAPAAAAKEAVT